MSDRRVLLTERHLQDIADAIREKRGSHDTCLPGEMADEIRLIEGETPTLEPLNATANGQYVPGEGVDGFDGATVAVPTFTAAVNDRTLILTGDSVTANDNALVIDGPRFIQRHITQNGAYFSADDGASGYSGVTVDVPANTGEKSIASNGDYDATSEGLDGYSRVSVRVGNVAWLAEAVVNAEYPFAAVESAFALNTFTFSTEINEEE